MKRLCLLLLWLAIVPRTQAQQRPIYVPDHAVIKGKIIVKVQEDIKGFPLNATQRSRLPFNLGNATALYPESQMKKGKRSVSMQAWRANYRKFGLHRMYEVPVATHENLEEVLTWLQQQPWVEYAEPLYKNAPHHEATFPTSTFSKHKPLAFSWAYTKARVDYAWGTEGLDGSGVIVAVIDQGTDLDHPALAGKLYENPMEVGGIPGVDDDGNGYIDDIYGYNFGSNTANVDAGSLGHGTQVAGCIVAANDLPSGSFAFGAAPGSKLLTVNTWNPSQNSYIDMVPAILYAAQEGARVINMSWGRVGAPSWYEQDMINYLTETYNIVFVASSGNDGGNNAYYPASYQNVLSVGHSNSSDQRHTGSSPTTFSYFNDVLAPGVGISVINTGGGFNNSITGSSYAAPLVSGIAALLIEKFPSLTGQQIAELIRTTADDVYAIAPNNTVPFKLGKGRVNAERAITGVNARPAVRMSNFNFASTAGRYILYGGNNLTLACDFTNYLTPSSANLQVTLSLSEDTPNCNGTNPPYQCTNDVTIVSNTVNLGTMNTLETKTGNFIVTIGNEYWKRVQFKLTFTDTGTGYTDYQYFDVVIRPNFFTKINRFSVGMDTDGRIGTTGTITDPVTPGLFYDELSNPLGNPNQFRAPMVKKLALMVANQDGSTVVDAAPTGITAGTPVTYTAENSDFTTLKSMRLYDSSTDGENVISFQGAFDDLGFTAPSSSIGLEIDHKIIGYSDATDLNYLVVEYNVKNKSGVDFDSLHLGIYADWDLHGFANPSPFLNSPLPYQPNRAAWDTNNEIGYVYNTSAGQYMGIHVLNANPSYYALDFGTNTGDNGNGVDLDPIVGGFSKVEKYQTMAHRVAKQEAGGGSGADVAQVVGTTIYQLPNNSERKVAFLFLFSTTETGLNAVKNQALLRVATNYTQATTPVVNLTPNCPANTLLLRPQSDGYYNFYKAPNLITPIFTGREYTVAPADIGETFHVTALNATRESAPTVVNTATTFVASAVANFTAPSTVNRTLNPIVNFTNTSTAASTWEWDFGDGSAITNAESPSHNFKAEGVYDVKLTINKGTPCEASITKTITIQSESPVPVITSPIAVCLGSNAVITPSGGTTFRFYDAPPPAGSLLNTGSSYTLTSVTTPTTVYLTNVDSALESPSLPVQIIVNAQPTAAFSVTAERRAGKNIGFSTVESGLTVTQWSFGDGTSSNLPNPTHAYTSIGTYTVSLTATNTNGCSNTQTETLVIIPDIAPPIIPDFYVCEGTSTTLSPTPNGIFRFYSSLPISVSTQLAEGHTYTTDPITSNSTIYVTRVEGGSESLPTAVTISVLGKPSADFNAPSLVNRSQQPNVAFIDTSSGDATAWEWNFGDGAPSVFDQNPTHTFYREGVFGVTLRVTNANGCTSSIQKNITIQSESPTPHIGEIAPQCPGSSVTLAPTNGSQFAFYAESSLSTLLQTGSTYTDPSVTVSTSIFIVNQDSAIQSVPKEVEIPVKPIRADFTVDPIQQKDASGRVYVTFDAVQAGWEFQWTFGDGNTISGVDRIEHGFEHEGNYTVTLTATDASGCQVQSAQTVTVLANAIRATESTLPSSPLPIYLPEGTTTQTNTPFQQLTNDLIIKEGATLKVPSSATLLVAGNLIVRGTLLTAEDARIVLKKDLVVEDNGTLLTYSGEFASLVFQNTAPQALRGNVPIRLQKLITEGGNLTLQTTLHVYESLELHESNLVTTSNHALVMHSSANGDATLWHRGNGNIVGGNAKFQRYIPNNAQLDSVPIFNGIRYHYLAGPVEGMPLAQLDREVTTGSFELNLNPAWNTQNGNVTPEQLANVFLYDEQFVPPYNSNSSLGWRVPSESALLESGRGYAISLQAGTTLTFQGTPHISNLSFPITKGTAEDAGWNLVGNPYPSPLNSRLFLQENLSEIDDALFVRISTGTQRGFYAVVNAAGLSVPSFVPLESLAIGQAFFVRKTQEGIGTLHFTRAMRTQTTHSFYRTATERPERWVRLQIEQQDLRHELLAVSAPADTDPKGIIALPHFSDFVPAIYLQQEKESWLIHEFAPHGDTLSVGVTLHSATDSATLLLAEWQGIAAIWLEDSVAKKSIPLTPKQPYRFLPTATQERNRFRVFLYPYQTVEPETPPNTPFAHWEGETLLIRFPTELTAIPSVQLFTVEGRAITPLRSAQQSADTWALQLPDGSHQILLLKVWYEGRWHSLKVLH